MPSPLWMGFLLSVVFLGLIRANPTPLDVAILTRNAPGASSADTHAAIARELRTIALEQRDTNYLANVQLDHSWQNATIFSIRGSASTPVPNTISSGGIAVSCKTCYISGLATASLVIHSNQSVDQIIDNTIQEAESDVVDTVNNTYHAIKEYVEHVNRSQIESYVEHIVHDLEGHDLHLSDFIPPQLNVTFNTTLSAVPDTTLTFGFRDLDLYLELETVLDASSKYSFSLIAPDAIPTSISLSSLLKLGVFFTADLILELDGSLDITGGLHIKVDDAALDLQLFGNEVSNIDIKGGQFELLPVTVQGGNTSLTATLRLGASATMSISTPSLPDVEVLGRSLKTAYIGGGIIVGVNADVATFKTEVMVDESEDAECKVKVVQDYSLAPGATAGAQVTAGTVTYGPAVSDVIAVYTTTLDSSCALQPTTTASPTITTYASVKKRQDYFNTSSTATATLTTTITQSAIQCPLSVTGQCPVSLQTTVTATSVSTTIVSGSEDYISSASETWPKPTTTVTRIPFGTGVREISQTSGSPTPYTAPTAPTGIGGVVSQVAHTVHDHKDLVIGLGVGIGVGVPVLAVLIGGACCFCFRRKIKSSRKTVG